jgi:hypothetical protein
MLGGAARDPMIVGVEDLHNLANPDIRCVSGPVGIRI